MSAATVRLGEPRPTMTYLPPATAAQRLLSQALPKRLVVRFRTKRLEGGRVRFTPVFTIDNLTVPNDLVTTAEEQTILGYQVIASPSVRHIVETTGGRPQDLERGLAADYQDALFDHGISVIAETGALLGKGRGTRLSVDLRLLPGDQLDVATRLTLDDGTVVPKPKDIQEVYADAGWMPFGKDLVKLGLTHTRLDQVLLEEGGDGILAGTLVPEFLKRLEASRAVVWQLSRDDALRRLAVVEGRGSPQLRVTGDEESIRVEAGLRIEVAGGGDVRWSDAEVMALPGDSRVFLRHDGGWIEVSGADIATYRAARGKIRLPAGELTGAAVPEALVALRAAAGKPWAVTVEADVAQAHDVLDARPETRFMLLPRACGGVVGYCLAPSYDYGPVSIEHDDMSGAIARREAWLRRERFWIKPSRDALEEVESFARTEQLVQTPGGFAVPAARTDAIRQRADRLGAISFPDAAGEPATVELDLALRPGDAIEVMTKLRREDGRESAAPPDMAQVRRDLGWHADGDDLVRIGVVDPAFDRLCAAGGRTTIDGADVPHMLLALGRSDGAGFGTIRKDDALAALSVRPVSVMPRLRMRGDGEEVWIESSLVLTTDDGQTTEVASSALGESRVGGTDFLRVRWGWAQVEGGALERFHAARRTVADKCPLDAPLRGSQIPDAVMALHRLVRTGQAGGSWRIDVARDVAQLHRTSESPGTPEFTLRIESEDGMPQATLSVVYRHESDLVPHATVKAAVAEGSRWVRHGERWFAIDRPAFDGVTATCDELGLYDVGSSFRVPLTALRVVESRLAGIGPVSRSPERIPEAALDVRLRLVDDTIVVTSTLLAEDGREIRKPSSLEDLEANAGLLADGESVVRCRLTNRPLERQLLARSGEAMFAGDAAPTLLRDLDASVPGVGRVSRDEAIAALEVLEGMLFQTVVVSGDADGIEVNLAYDVRLPSGRSRPVAAPDLQAIRESGARFLRIDNGWLAVDPATVSRLANFREAVARQTPLGQRVTGAAIPATLDELAALKAMGWRIAIPLELENNHRRIKAKAAVTFEVSRVFAERRPDVIVRPAYTVEGIAVSHAAAVAATRDTEGWHRATDVWIKIDSSITAHVESTLRNLGYEPRGAEFVVPVQCRPMAVGALEAVGAVRTLPTDALGGGLEMSLALTDDDRLTARYRVLLDDGTAITPAASFAELVADQGFVCHDRRLVEVSLPPGPPYDLLIAATDASGLSGQDVPRCLEQLSKSSNAFRHLVLEGVLERLDVSTAKTRPRVAITGDENHLFIEPELALVDSAGRPTGDVITVAEGREAAKRSSAYKRVATGWLAVGPREIAPFNALADAVAKAVPIGQRIEGVRIPRALKALAPTSPIGRSLSDRHGLHEIVIANGIAQRHRVIDTKAETTFVLRVAPLADRPSCTLEPTFVHGQASVSHEQVRRCLDADEEFARTPEGWVSIDAEAFAKVGHLAQRLGLEGARDGYLVPMRERQRVRSAMRAAGTVTDIPARPQTAEVVVDLDLDDDDTLRIDSRLALPDGTVIPKPRSIDVFLGDDCWLAWGAEIVHVPAGETATAREFLEQSAPKTIGGQSVPRILKRLPNEPQPGLRIDRNDRLASAQVIEGVSRAVLKVSTHGDGIQVDPGIQLETTTGAVVDIPDEWLMAVAATAVPEGGHGYARTAEGWAEVHQSAIRRYQKAKPTLERAFPSGLRIDGEGVPDALVKLHEIDAEPRAASPWNVYFLDDVHEQHRLVTGSAAVSFTLDVLDSGGQSLLHLDPSYDHERFRFNHREVAGFVDSATRWVRRGTSWIEIDTKSYERVDRQLEELGLEPRDEGFVFPATARERVLPLFTAIGTVEYTQAYGDFIAKLADFTSIDEVPLPTNLRKDVILREYQQHGFNWLAFLQRFGLNGILADDMGLGKTLQTLAVVERAREVTGSDKPVLIVCPASVVHNWRSEIERFLVDSTVVVFQGTARDHSGRRLDAMARGTARPERRTYVVTSYDIVHREIDRLRAIPWLYVVCDEGHHIKNPSAKRSRLVKAIAGQHKLVLTGTPIQNGLVELWSLFDFAMPGYLGSQTEFTKKYCGGGGGPAWQAIRDELATRIRPFVLRRLKTDVAKDLPEKLVIHHDVELTPLQVKLYKEHLDSAEVRDLVSRIDTDGVARAHPHIFTILDKLRSICNHPVLVKDDRDRHEARAEDSAKLAFLEELLDEVREGGHRALLFCRSTRMHTILEKHLALWNHRYLRLDGSTPTEERHKLVDTFNATPEITVFLLSMAGNTGINLTGADTVIFYDHDWNPANDNQAMDRAYRIGQTKTVTVYRLVSKGTIEERILDRQRLKQMLADEVIGSDTAGFKDLSREEVLALFRLDE